MYAANAAPAPRTSAAPPATSATTLRRRRRGARGARGAAARARARGVARRACGATGRACTRGAAGFVCARGAAGRACARGLDGVARSGGVRPGTTVTPSSSTRGAREVVGSWGGKLGGVGRADERPVPSTRRTGPPRGARLADRPGGVSASFIAGRQARPSGRRWQSVEDPCRDGTKHASSGAVATAWGRCAGLDLAVHPARSPRSCSSRPTSAGSGSRSSPACVAVACRGSSRDPCASGVGCWRPEGVCPRDSTKHARRGVGCRCRGAAGGSGFARARGVRDGDG